MFTLIDIKQYYKKNNFLSVSRFSFPNSGLVIIKGPNGSGKTTLLKTMLGFLEYDGTILYNGQNIKEIGNSLFKKVCYVPQFNILFENLTLKENITVNSIFKHEDINIINGKKKIRKMSGGQQKYANLSRTKHLNYECYILDEPTVSLDKSKKQELLKLINIEKNNKLIIIVSHDELFDSYADNIIDINSINNENHFNHENNLDKSNFSEKNKISKYLFFKLFKGNILNFFIRTVILTISVIAFFCLASTYFESEDKILKSYVDQLYNYCTIKDEKSNENIYDDFVSGNGKFDTICIETEAVAKTDDNSNRITFYKLFFHNSEKVIVSDYFLYLMNGLDVNQQFNLSVGGKKSSISIDAVDTTVIDKLIPSNKDDSLLNLVCCYIVLPRSYLSNLNLSDLEISNALYAIKDSDVLLDGYNYVYLYEPFMLRYYELKIQTRMISIPLIIIALLLLLYLDEYQTSNTKKFETIKNKLIIFGADKSFVFKILFFQELISVVFTLIFLGFGIWGYNQFANQIVMPNTMKILNHYIIDVSYFSIFITLLFMIVILGFRSFFIKKEIDND